MKTTGLLFLMMVWAAWTQGMSFTALPSGPPPTMNMREAPWSAVAAATAFPPSFAHLPYESKAEGGSCCYRTPRRLRHTYFRESGTAEPPGSRRPVRRNLHKPKASLPQPLANGRPRSPSGNVLHPAGANKTGGAVDGGFIRTGTTNNALASRAPSAIRPTAPPLSAVRHRGPNPAVVGGAPNIHGSNTGAINGTRMNRKP
jgi:hypothetical protein